MELNLYRKLKGADPANSIVAGNLLLNGVDFLAPNDVDSETLFKIDIRASEAELLQIKKTVIDAMINPNQHAYLLRYGHRREGNLKRKRYGATIAVKTDFDPEAIEYLDVLRTRYGLGERVDGVTRYSLWHLTFRDAALKPAERRAYALQLQDFFANPNFQRATIRV